MITSLCARRMGQRTTAALALRAIPARMPRPQEPPQGEFFGTYLAQLPDLRGFFRLLAAAVRTGVLASWLVTGCVLLLAVGRFCVRAGCTGGVRHRSPRRGPPVRAPGLTWGFWWQVQDSNLGRLSSAILQTVAGTALTCANTRQGRDLGTHWTWWHRTDRTHSPSGSSFTDHAEVRAGRGLVLRGGLETPTHAAGRSVIPSAPARGLNFLSPTLPTRLADLVDRVLWSGRSGRYSGSGSSALSLTWRSRGTTSGSK
jgi:hypothetical protein